ncbi:MAG TPA: hypothetical protein VHD56_06965 [Tepidisphaeraceae bacterium]|nr:hypothetical protein [Tepidisphaeraceae bacterium]
MTDNAYPKIASLKNVAAFRARLSLLSLDLPCDDSVLSAGENSPLAQSLEVNGFKIGNRWCIHPMEGWDGTATGEPTEKTRRRWQHFGESGAKFIWGGEAFAVTGAGRANPNQLAIVDNNVERAENGARNLLQTLLNAHRAAVGAVDDLLIGLQLTHSGRFCKPTDHKKLAPRIAYHHPTLDPKFGIRSDDSAVIVTDDEIDHLIDDYVKAARLAQRAGFHFVDVKHCHGYFAHELLSAFTRPGKFGGSFENRTRFAREIIGRIRSECPGLIVGVRLSAFDMVPGHRGFGWNGTDIDLAEPIQFIRLLESLGVRLINVTCGSPYYNPHIQRPAIFPPSDGYAPPEDPLVGVARQIDMTRKLKQACPNSIFVGSGYTYLQEYLPHVAQAAVRQGWTDFVGLGRLVLSYWNLPADTLAGRGLQAKRICRTFSDCTTAPRMGMVSGCYPLDDYYKKSPEHIQLKEKKRIG